MDSDRGAFGAALGGTQRYSDHDERIRDPDNARIYVRVKVKQVEVLAMVDTGAPYCVIPPPIGPSAQPGDPQRTLMIRGDTYDGHLTRGHLVLQSDSGQPTEVEATFFVPDWEGEWVPPILLGLGRCVESSVFRTRPSALPDPLRCP